MSFHDSIKNLFFQNIKIKRISNKVILVLKLLNSRTWMTLKTLCSSDFPCLRNFWSPFDLGGLCNFTGLRLNSHISSKSVLILMVWSSLTPKWPILDMFCGMDHQKPNCSLMFIWYPFWQRLPMLLFWKLVDETQMPKPQEYTDTLSADLFGVMGHFT